MGGVHSTLASILSPTDTVACRECERNSELRFWTYFGHFMVCPVCRFPRDVSDAISEAREGTTWR